MQDPEGAALRQEVANLRARVAELERTTADEAPFLEALLKALPATVLRFDADLRIRFVSRLQPGMTEADVLGRPALDFIPAEDHELASTTITTSLRTGEPGAYQTIGPGPDGTRRQYDVFVAPVPEPDGRPGGCFVALDVSQLQETQRALHFALASTGLGLWSWDMASNVLVWDERMKQLMGRTEPLTLPDYIEHVVHPDDRALVRGSGERTFSSGQLEPVAHRIVRPDGEIRWMLTVGQLERDPEGRPVRIRGGNLDITEQRGVEEQLRRAQKLEAVGRLTAGIAHNFNNMLMVMQPNLDLLRQVVPASHRALLDDASEAAERAADMVKKLMTLAGQRRRAAPQPCDAGDLARRLVVMCQRTFDRHVDLHLEVTAAQPWVRADAGDLEQVVMNLLLNARDAVTDPPAATPRIEVLVTNAAVPGKGAGAMLALHVKDAGPGLSEAARAHAFEPFFTSKDVGRGTGLGLATSQAIVRELGGRIELHSPPGEGTTVSVLLPTCEPPAGAKAQPAATAVAKSAGGSSVLVVDDEPMVGQVVVRILEAQGYRVTSAEGGAAALAELSRAPVDLVLLDRSMPGEPPAAILSRLREAAPAAKIVLFTGEEVPPSEQGTVDGVIQKPVRADDLIRTVAGLLRPAQPVTSS